MRIRRTGPQHPPYKVFGALLLVLLLGVAAGVYGQFRGTFSHRVELTVLAARAGLVMDPGSKVTYNGVAIGRVDAVTSVDVGDVQRARLSLSIDPKYQKLLPANVHADIQASTIFGNKYVAFSAPDNPDPRRVSSADVIDISSETTEFNTLFETVTSISEKVDPVKLNTTLSATADALTGLGEKFGHALVQANDVLGEINPQLPQIHRDVNGVADLAEVYADAAPDLLHFLDDAATTARTLHDQQTDLDQTLMASVGLGNTGADLFRRTNPFLGRSTADLVRTAALLDEYSPMLFCTIRKFNEQAPIVSQATGANGYSAVVTAAILGAENPYVYPDNLPRVNASGGPGGRPGCWPKITRDLWPAPYMVMDTGASIAPYNHFALGQPLLRDYVWGRQIGQDTINP